MTERVDLDGDGEQLRSGLVTLVLALVEIVDDALEREAVRRMEAGQLTDEEIERVGTQLRRLEAEIHDLEKREGVREEVTDFRERLDGALDGAIDDLAREEFEEWEP
jgi:hypothetical protein